jgi:hypothetical protein
MSGELKEASGKAYQVLSLLRVVRLADENECSGVLLDWKGISQTLEVAEELMAEVIVRVEHLERFAKIGPMHGNN